MTDNKYCDKCEKILPLSIKTVERECGCNIIWKTKPIQFFYDDNGKCTGRTGPTGPIQDSCTKCNSTGLIMVKIAHYEGDNFSIRLDDNDDGVMYRKCKKCKLKDF